MQVAYVNVLPEPFVTGLYTRLVGQAKACRRENLPFDFILFTNSKGKIDRPELFSMLPLPQDRSRIGRHIALRRAIANCVAKRYAAVILAHITLSPFFSRFQRDRKYALMIEHHTKEGDICFGTGRWIAGLCEILFAKSCLGNVDGLIAVNEEIRDYEQQRSGLKREQTIAISNGIDVPNITFTKFQPFDGKELHLGMVTTGVFSWNGLDRVIQGMRKYKGDVKIKLHIAGNIKAKDIDRYAHGKYHDIELYGTLSGNNLEAFYCRLTVGLSCLALHRVGITQAAPLRTREYVARGLPFVLAYEDPDLPKTAPFMLHVPSEDSPISMQEVVNFCTGLAQQYEGESLSSGMRALSLEKMDWGKKMREYYLFAQEIAERRSRSVTEFKVV